MEDPAHNFVVESGIVTSNSHAVCVALDSLYGAYAKAHYPLEYYTTLLSNYAAKGDKDRIALTKEEMRNGFGIRVVPCHFRQDNRDFFLDRAANTISDALTSVKHIGQRVAEALYTMKDNPYTCFVDVLHDMEVCPSFDATAVSILIRMGYFQEFGTAGKLLRVFQEFRTGSIRFSKTHVPATQQKRLSALRQFAEELPEEDIHAAEQILFEVEHYGTILSTFSECRGQYALLEVDDRYSPKLRLYNLATGSVGMMKVKKDTYRENPLIPGMMIRLLGWERRPAYQFEGGKPINKTGVTELWIRAYTLV